MNKYKKILIGFLIVIMILPYNAKAVEQNGQRQEDLTFLWNTLKGKHPNIIANTTEEKLLLKKAEIEATSENKTDIEFYLDLSNLLAMIGDSHTSIGFSSAAKSSLHILPVKIENYLGNWILSSVEKEHEAYLGQSVVAINRIPISEVAKRFKAIISADNEIKFIRQFKGQFYVEEILAYLGIVNSGTAIPITVQDKAGKTNDFIIKSISASEKVAPDFMVSLSKKQAALPVTSYDKSKFYKSLPLNNKTYYIQYNVCQEDKKVPMKSFVAQVKNDLSNGKYNKVLLDFRNNGGGSDGVIMPLLSVLTDEIRQKETKLYGLIGEATYSSAVINAVMVKEIGGILVGSPTSGSVNHFGSVNSFTLPHSGFKVGVSSKFINLSEFFESVNSYGIESLRPDLLVDQTIDNYISGLDTAVDYLVNRGEDISLPINNTEGLTRARAVEMLYELAGKDSKSFENRTAPFKDVFQLAYYQPAVEWAKENGIIKGKGLTFNPTSLITREEFAVMLHNFVKYSKLTPQIKHQTVSFSDEAFISAWACDAVNTTYKWGLIEAELGDFKPKDTLTRLEGESIIQKLKL